ncbi:hypothetical protein ABZU75_21750 [Streptosporangium sp. NPDC005286]|uniref:hypothetical protein n=1 Tax=Streptosporangium sp. NPDC005286 TaxID=3154463 RepID=UPI0033B04034
MRRWSVTAHVHHDDAGTQFLGQAHGFVPVGGLAHEFQVGGGGDDHLQGGADQRLVVGQDDVDRHRTAAGRGRRAVTRKPPSGRGPAEKLPRSMLARSRIPTRP